MVTRCFQIMTARTESQWRRHSNLVISPDVREIGWNAFESASLLVEAGERAAKAVMPQILRWLRNEPVGYLYDVVTNGFGAMYGYSSQIPPRDRWAIIAYVRALQLSRNAPASELPAELQERLKAGGPAK